jgi:hypothetical protein
MLMTLFMFAKRWKFTTKKTFGYIIYTYFKISKTFDVGVFYVFKVELLKLLLNLYSLGVTIFF